MIVTIDGPAGSGKSTVAKRLAEQLGFGAACVPSSPLLVQDPYVLLAHALAATTTSKDSFIWLA